FLLSCRRGHTMLSRDWSSDVCSSDLDRLGARLAPGDQPQVVGRPAEVGIWGDGIEPLPEPVERGGEGRHRGDETDALGPDRRQEIGRAAVGTARAYGWLAGEEEVNTE